MNNDTHCIGVQGLTKIIYLSTFCNAQTIADIGPGITALILLLCSVSDCGQLVAVLHIF